MVVERWQVWFVRNRARIIASAASMGIASPASRYS